jgi:hypothetical protein
MDQRQDTNRRPVAVAVTSDGRRVPVVLPAGGLADSSLPSILRVLVLDLAGLVGLLITGSRRENGGTGRNERQ